MTLRPNTMYCVGTVTRRFASEKFVSLNVELEVGTEASPRKTWLDTAFFGSLVEKATTFEVGDKISLIARPDRNRGKDGVWRSRYVGLAIIDGDSSVEDELDAIAEQEELLPA